MLEHTRNVMEKKGLDALIAMSPECVTYSIGCAIPSNFLIRRRHAISITPLDGAQTLIVADMEEGHARAFSSVEDIKVYREFSLDPIDLLVSVLKDKGLDRGQIGIELQYIPALDFDKLRKKLPSVRFIGSDDLLEEAFTVKSDRHIQLLREVAEAAEKAILEGFETIEPGMTENDLARIMITKFYREGGDGIRILVIGSGERSSYPNVGPSGRVIQKGDLIRVDFLGVKEYFMSDVCRTAIVGKPSIDQEATWGKLTTTKDKVLETVKPGVKASEVYDAYLKIWSEFGFKPVRFIGHGLGLSAHERPFLGDIEEMGLQEGMILCVEPLLLIPGIEGYHVEDEILVTKDGYENLTTVMDTSRLYEIG